MRHPASITPSVAQAAATMLAVAAVVVAAAPAPAAAQEAVVEGPGYEIAEGTVLHPGVGIETGVVSNVFYEQGGGVTAPVLRLRGSFAIASQGNEDPGEAVLLMDPDEVGDAEGKRGAPTLDFRLSGHLVREQYLVSSDGAAGYRVSEQSNFYGGLDAHVMTMPQGVTSLFVDDQLLRVTGPRSYESASSLNRVINHLSAGARFRPGNGALELRGQYENTVDVFESSDSSFANRLQHLLRVQAAWKFLPVTRFFFDGSFGYFGPLSGAAAGGCASGGLQKCRSMPLRLELGAASAITQVTTVRAHAGFGKGFYEAGQDFTNVLFGAELGMRYSPMGRFTVSYEYGFEDSVQANFYRDHTLAGRVDHQIDLILLEAGLDLRLRGYRGIPQVLGPPSRDDLIVHLFGKGHYLYRDWLAFTAELDLVSDQTGYQYTYMSLDDPSYQRILFQLGAVAAF